MNISHENNNSHKIGGCIMIIMYSYVRMPPGSFMRYAGLFLKSTSFHQSGILTFSSRVYSIVSICFHMFPYVSICFHMFPYVSMPMIRHSDPWHGLLLHSRMQSIQLSQRRRGKVATRWCTAAASLHPPAEDMEDRSKSGRKHAAKS